jgi:hypothetical protein
MSKNSGFLQDDSGNLSSTRLALLLWVIGVLVIWGAASLKTGELKAIPDSVTTVIGLLMGGKVMQKFGERSEVKPTLSAHTAPVTMQPPPAGHMPNIDTLFPTTPRQGSQQIFG